MNDNRTINTNEGYSFEALRRLAGEAMAREFLLVKYILEKRQAGLPDIVGDGKNLLKSNLVNAEG